MKNLGLGMFLVLVTGQAFASAPAQLICAHDMRPVDGNLVEVTLDRQANGLYSGQVRTVTAGFGGPVEERIQKINTGLKCNFAEADQRIASCFKSSQDENEKSNSGITISHVTRRSADYKGGLYTEKNFEIEAFSPLLAQRIEITLPEKGAGIPSGCEVK